MVRVIEGIKNYVEQSCRFESMPIHAPPGGGGDSQKNWVGVCGPHLKTLTLFMTKIGDIPYPIYDLTKNSKPLIYDLACERRRISGCHWFRRK